MCSIQTPLFSSFFFFNDTATTEIYTLSLHDALPILSRHGIRRERRRMAHRRRRCARGLGDRKSTRLNSSHLVISYAVFCLKKKNKSMLGRLCRTRSVSECGVSACAPSVTLRVGVGVH